MMMMGGGVSWPVGPTHAFAISNGNYDGLRALYHRCKDTMHNDFV